MKRGTVEMLGEMVKRAKIRLKRGRPRKSRRGEEETEVGAR